MHQLRENTGNELISELAQAPHCSVVTACHYHKHRLTLVHAHTSFLAIVHTYPHTTPNTGFTLSMYMLPFLTCLYPFSPCLSFSRHYGTQCCCAVIISSCSSFLNLFYPLSNQHWDYTSLRCSCFPPRQQTECFECCCHMGHQARLLPPNLT